MGDSRCVLSHLLRLSIETPNNFEAFPIEISLLTILLESMLILSYLCKPMQVFMLMHRFNIRSQIKLTVKGSKVRFENRNSNITMSLACLIKTFEGCRLVQQIR